MRPAGQKTRYLFIDFFRGLVVLFMLEGHLFRELLHQDVIKTTFFQFHDLFHGISAPAFLFGSGLTFVLSTRRRWEDYHHWDPPFARRLGRILIILFLGYSLHLPFLSAKKLIIEGRPEHFIQLFQSDVLQCIGFGLLLLHGLIFFFKTERRFYGLVLSATVAIPLLTPLIWEVDFSKHFPIAVSQLLNNKHGSLFPLFPFVGFLFAGVIVSWEFMYAVEHKREHKFMKRFIYLGIVFVLVGLLMDAIPIQIYPVYNFWYTSPNYFLIRIGALLFLIGLIWKITEKIKTPPKWITILGKESLLVYVTHLIILYGSVINPFISMRTIFGTDLQLIETIPIFIAFAILMIALAFLWSYLKEKKYNLYRIIQISIAAIFLTLIFTLEY